MIELRVDAAIFLASHQQKLTTSSLIANFIRHKNSNPMLFEHIKPYAVFFKMCIG